MTHRNSNNRQALRILDINKCPFRNCILVWNYIKIELYVIGYIKLWLLDGVIVLQYSKCNKYNFIDTDSQSGGHEAAS
jgi:hypothetical protein